MHSYLYKFHAIDLSIKKLLSWNLLWNYKSAFHGRGLEFQEFRNREEWEDSANIDWFISSREGKILVKKMQEERNISILQVIDEWLLSSQLFRMDKKNILEQILFLTSLSALENSDRVGVQFLGEETVQYFPYSKKKSQLFQVYTYLQRFSSYKKRYLLWISQIRVKNNLIFVYTDSFDLDWDYFKVLALHNDIIVVHIFHSFENTLESSSESSFLFSSSLWEVLSLSTQNDTKRKEYVSLRNRKIELFQKDLRKIGVDYLLLDEKKDIAYESLKFMKNRWRK